MIQISQLPQHRVQKAVGHKMLDPIDDGQWHRWRGSRNLLRRGWKNLILECRGWDVYLLRRYSRWLIPFEQREGDKIGTLSAVGACEEEEDVAGEADRLHGLRSGGLVVLKQRGLGLEKRYWKTWEQKGVTACIDCVTTLRSITPSRLLFIE